jgi:hypothetical protein
MASRKLSSAAGAGAESGGAMGAAREPSPENLLDAHAAEGLEASGLDSTGIDTQGYMREDRWPGSADLWIAGAQAPVESPIAAASEGEASAMRDKLLAEIGDEDEDENFIQDDDSAGDDDDEFGNEWRLGTVGAIRRPASGVRRRPDSAVHKKSDIHLPRPPCPTMDRFRVPVTRLDPEEARELRLNAVWPSFVVSYHVLVSRKYAVGASKMLLQYLQRGYPEYTVDAIVNGVRSVAKMRPGSAVGFRGVSGGGPGGGEESAVGTASLTLLVMGNYCAELLRASGHLDQAKKILNKVELLTSVYTAPFAHKILFRVWTLCNMAMLQAEKGQPRAALDFLDTARDEAYREDDTAAQIIVSNVRAALLCRIAHFSHAAADLLYARTELTRLQDSGLSPTLGPAPNGVGHHLDVAALYNSALAAMCAQDARYKL